jgi:hypothetical protein
MDHLSDEARFTAEQNKMFDIAETAVYRYIASFLGLELNEVCSREIEFPEPEPLVFYPIDGYKEDKYLSFRLAEVPTDYSLDLSHLAAFPEVKDGIGFIVNSVYEVFSAIINVGLTEKVMELIMVEKSFHLEFDETTHTFVPIFVFPQKRKLSMCKQFLDEYTRASSDEKLWNDIPEETRNAYVQQAENIAHLVEHLMFDEEVAKQKEIEQNAEYSTANRLGIIFQELDRSELPESLRDADVANDE